MMNIVRRKKVIYNIVNEMLTSITYNFSWNAKASEDVFLDELDHQT